MKNKTPRADYKVGYRKPPKHTQFRKGSSGNTRGRQPGDENMLAAFKRVVQKLVVVKIGDRAVKMSLAEAVIHKNYAAAMQGDPSAMSNMIRLSERTGEFTNHQDSKAIGKPLAVPKRIPTIAEFMETHSRPLTAEQLKILSEGGREQPKSTE